MYVWYFLFWISFRVVDFDDAASNSCADERQWLVVNEYDGGIRRSVEFVVLAHGLSFGFVFVIQSNGEL